MRVHTVDSLPYPWHPDFRIAKPIAAFRLVPRIMEEVKPDIVHVQAHFVIGRAGINAARRHHLPLVATNHFMPENLEVQLPLSLPQAMIPTIRSIAWRDAKRMYGKTDVVTAPTSYAARLVEKRTGLLGVRAISNGVVLPPRRVRSSVRKPVVLYVGRLDPEKRVDELITAMQWVDGPLRLHIAGDGIAAESLKRCAKDVGVADRVDFLGRVSDGELAAELGQATLFCMPSRAELQSIASLEAMAAGLPVVGARAHALPELVRPEANGLLYEPGNVGQLADCINRIARADTTWNSMSACAEETARRHGLDNTLEAFEALYREVIQSRAA